MNYNSGTTTNSDVFFEYRLPSGESQLEIQHIAYKKIVFNLRLNGDTTLVCFVEPDTYVVDEIAVIYDTKSRTISGILEGRVELNMDSLKALPKFLGNNDPLRILQLTPGVQTTNDGESGMFIRGGESGHNLIIWNDAPIYNASHLLGTFSIFNAGHVGEFKLSKSNIGAEYGGRLSAVISVESPEQIPDKLHTNEIGVYISDKFHVTSEFWTEVGIRYSGNMQIGAYRDLK